MPTATHPSTRALDQKADKQNMFTAASLQSQASTRGDNMLYDIGHPLKTHVKCLFLMSIHWTN